jgi:Orsellinic acid/F9775 biosynthesis cluster protein D
MAATTTTTPTELIHLVDSFYYNADFRVLLCAEHKTCLDYRLIQSHLKNYHRGIKPSEYPTKFAILANYTFNTPEATPKPAPFRYYFDKLPEYSNYSLCRLCFYSSQTEKRLRIHLNEKHSINLNTKAIKKADYIQNNIKVQTLYRDSKYQYYFPTSQNNQVDAISNPVSSNPRLGSNSITILLIY